MWLPQGWQPDRDVPGGGFLVHDVQPTPGSLGKAEEDRWRLTLDL
jgi:hypothetical protein